MYEEVENETTDKGGFDGELRQPSIAYLRVVNSRRQGKNEVKNTSNGARVNIDLKDIALNIGENMICRFGTMCSVDLVENMPVNAGLGFIKLISGDESVLLNGTPLRPRMGKLLSPKDVIHFGSNNRWVVDKLIHCRISKNCAPQRPSPFAVYCPLFSFK